ncbi:glycosyltransferase family 2 protein [Asanoa sp. WMMD1127]|uniref:glycosyltransferase n=1 Tax=Asanoa sp. WMMD1127 TaxID=3016107 RepID=UPI002415C888|nr:glycosyltransferase family 2 protein [Asanoa sp. WMMD1127]MDG4827109.1 glycosyltransferase family 2 protein [Asanoa sp. WMMD1127]
MTALAWLPALLAGALTLHAVVNARFLRRPSAADFPDRVAVLLPVRDEAARVGPCLRALLDQRGVPELSILVLDDGSTDGTADVVRSIAGADPRVRLLTGAPLPPGWLGKPHACQQLAAAAGPDASVLVFVDADVVLAPSAVASCAALLRAAGVGLLSPYPWIVAESWGERLVQPLLQWSWLTFLPLRAMERSARPSLTAAGGQLLVVDRTAYDAAGGHAAVRSSVLEDIALARAVKLSGGRIALADGSRVASCRMYGSWSALAAGYSKSLWASFGSPAGALSVVVFLFLVYVAPVLLFVAGLAVSSVSLILAGVAGYALGVLGRVATAAATGGRWWPDALAQPVSVVLFGALVARSCRLRRAGALRWRDRPVVPS